MSGFGTGGIHKTTDKAIEVLDFIRRSNGAVFDDVVQQFDMSSSTAYTHLNTLRRQGLIVRENGRYWIGLRFREFSVSARTRKPSYQIVVKEIRGLTDDTNIEVEFLVEEAGRVNLLYHSKSVRHDRVRLFLHNTAAGKAILAELPHERVLEILDRWGLPRQTSNTITDRETLFEQLDVVAERGYAYNDRECFEGYHGVGAAVRGIDGSILGALTLGGPVYRVAEERLRNEMVDLLLESVDDLEDTIESQRATITAEMASR
jgi:DNA-binding IclR family transcriptional regulator